MDWEACAFLNPIGLLESSIKQFDSIIHELDDNDDDPFIEKMNEMSKNILNFTKDMLVDASANEKENLTIIKNYLNQYLSRYQNNDHVYSKYLWFRELLKWIENEGNERLKFYYLRQVYNEKE